MLMCCVVDVFVGVDGCVCCWRLFAVDVIDVVVVCRWRCG